MSKDHGRTHWLDESTDAPLIHDYAHRLSGFIEAMADGKIETQELKDQEARLVALMKKVEPELERSSPRGRHAPALRVDRVQHHAYPARASCCAAQDQVPGLRDHLKARRGFWVGGL